MGDQAENQDGKNGSDEPDCSAEPAHIQNSFYARPQLSLVPLRHTKVVHLIRHGLGFHNVAGQNNPTLYGSEEYMDAHLTSFGWRQAMALGDHIRRLESKIRVDAVISSTLTRALETAVGVFSPRKWESSHNVPPLLISQNAVPNKKAAQHALTSLGCPPIIAHELPRESLGPHPCDRRRKLSEITPAFPAIDFSHCKEECDVLWKRTHESKEDLKIRALHFAQWLMRRPEKHIAVVTHSVFLLHFMSIFGHSYAPEVQGEMHRWFENCEMRTLVLVDEAGSSGGHDELHFHGGTKIHSN